MTTDELYNIKRHAFLEILVLVKGLNRVILAQAAEGVDEMCTEVGVDVLRSELRRALPVH